NDLLYGLGIGLLLGVILGMLNGGVAFIEHFILRLLLWRANRMPLNYPHFLDYAAERILLRKVGGGYLFIHRMLRDYFTTLKTSSSNKEKGNVELRMVNEAMLFESKHIIYIQRYIYPKSTYLVFRKPYTSDEEFVISADAKQVGRRILVEALDELTIDS